MRKRHLIFLGCLAFAFLSIPAALYRVTGLASPASIGEWGQWGDLFGGVLNPLFAALAFFAVLWNIQLQQKQLDITQEQAKESAKATQVEIEELKRRVYREELAMVISRTAEAIDSIFDTPVSDAGSAVNVRVYEVLHEGMRWGERAAHEQGPYRQYVKFASTPGTVIAALHRRLLRDAQTFARVAAIYRGISEVAPLVDLYQERFSGLGKLLHDVGGADDETVKFYGTVAQ